MRRRGEDGVTLIEMMVVMVLFSIISASVFSVVMSGHRAERFSSDLREAMDQARVASERFRGEVRQARQVYSPNPSGVWSDDRTLSFWVDDDNDGSATPGEQVTWALVEAGGTGELHRWTEAAPTPRVLARGLDLSPCADTSWSRFTYDRDAGTAAAVAPACGTPPQPPASTDLSYSSVVRIHLRVDPATITSGQSPLEIVETVRLRNARTS